MTVRNSVLLISTILFFLALAKSVFFSFYGFGIVDEGEILTHALRILDNQIPYRDFFAIFPPIHYYFSAWMLQFFGLNILAPRIIASIIFAFVPVLVYLLSRRQGKEIVAILSAAAIIFLDVNSYRLFFFTPILFAVWLLLNGLDNRNGKMCVLAGLMLGISTWFRIDFAGVFGLGLGIGLLVRHKIKPLIYLGIGYLFPVAGLLIWLVKNDLLPLFVESLISRPLLITKLHSLTFPVISELVPLSLTVGSLGSMFNAVYGYLILLTLFTGVAVWLRQKNIESEKTMFLICGILFLPYFLGRSDLGHSVKASFPILILMPGIASYSKQLKEIIFSALFIILIFGLGQSYWWLKFNNSVVVIGNESLRVNADYKKGSTLPSADTLRESVDFIKNNASSGEKTLVLPYMAGLYYLSQSLPPTKYNNILTGFIINEREFIESTNWSEIGAIVYDPTNGPKMANNLVINYNPLLHQFIVDNYRTIKTTLEGWLLMKKSNDK